MADTKVTATAVKTKTCKKVDRYEVTLADGTEVGSLYLPKNISVPVTVEVQVKGAA